MLLTLTAAEKAEAEQQEGESDETWTDRLRELLTRPEILVNLTDLSGTPLPGLSPGWQAEVRTLGTLDNPFDVHAIYRRLAFRLATEDGETYQGRLVAAVARLDIEKQQASGESGGLSTDGPTAVPVQTG